MINVPGDSCGFHDQMILAFPCDDTLSVWCRRRRQPLIQLASIYCLQIIERTREFHFKVVISWLPIVPVLWNPWSVSNRLSNRYINVTQLTHCRISGRSISFQAWIDSLPQMSIKTCSWNLDQGPPWLRSVRMLQLQLGSLFWCNVRQYRVCTIY